MPSDTPDFGNLLHQIDQATRRQVEQWPDRASGYDDVMRLTADLAREMLAEPAPSQAFGPEPDAAESLRHHGVFLGGSPKGGTTMLVQLFDNHPDCVVMPGDSRMVYLLHAPPEQTEMATLLGYWLRQTISPNALPPFWTLGAALEPYRRLAHAYRHWRGELAARPSGFFLAAVLALAHASRRANATRFVEKTCGNVLRPERVFGEYPLAKMIQIVRDPYATLAALARQSSVRRWDWPFQARLDHVRSTLQAAVANPGRFGDERYRLVSYERLVAEPEPTMRALAEFVGLDYHPTLTTPTVLGHPAESNSMFSERRATGRLVAEDTGAAHRRWAEAFSPVEQEAILDALGDLADELGYPPPVLATAG